MKNILGSVLAACLVVSMPAASTAQQTAAAQPEDAAKLAEAHAIIDIMYPPAERQATMEKLVGQLSAQFRQGMSTDDLGDPGLKKIVEDALDSLRPRQSAVLQKHMPEIFEATATAYTHEFSLAQLKDIHAFALTPSGSRYLQRSSAILGDPAVAKANTALIADAQAMANSARTELKDKIIAYVKAHPDVAAKIAAESKMN
jgi:hypothetical protein